MTAPARSVAAALTAGTLLLVAGSVLAPPHPAVAAAPTAPPAGTSTDSLRLTHAEALDDRVVDLTFDTPRLDPPFAQVRVRVLLPAHYSPHAAPYPVVFLLHGAGDDYTSWTTPVPGQPSLEEFTADKDVLIVMPEAGQHATAGWYSDWYDDGAQDGPDWETFHIRQLIPFIKDTYRVRTDAGGWVVAGLSMGGFGAMSYAARHPDRFGGAFAFSGAVDTRYFSPVDYADPPGTTDDAVRDLLASHGAPPVGVWGPWATQAIRWRGHNPADLAGNLRGMTLWLTTGRGLPGGPAMDDTSALELGMEAAVAVTNDSFDRVLTAQDIPHSYEPYPVGGHVWWYWQQAFRRAWPTMAAVFTSPRPAPDSFDYRSIEPDFDVWGWHVINDPARAVEFLALTEVTPQGLRLTGSGTVQLMTPASYRPQQKFTVTIRNAAGTATADARADEHGRLGIHVPLGPAHRLQEGTPAQRLAAQSPSYWQTATVTITPTGN
jgi:S-formylglutathione hydrolase FrmB